MLHALAQQTLAQMEECLLDLEDLGWTLAAARLSQAIDSVRDELASLPASPVAPVIERS